MEPISSFDEESTDSGMEPILPHKRRGSMPVLRFRRTSGDTARFTAKEAGRKFIWPRLFSEALDHLWYDASREVLGYRLPR
jgi:hypothetical protein